MKYKIHKVICFLLSILTLLTSITSYAGEFNGAGFDYRTCTSTHEHVGSMRAWHYAHGFRCTILNESGMPISNDVHFVSAYPWDLNKLKSDGAKATNEEYEYMINNYYKNVGMWRNANYTEGSADNYTAKQTYDIYQKYELN